MKNFRILVNDWHISDHRPISLDIEANCDIDVGWLLKRAIDLNSSSSDSANEVIQFRGNYDYDGMKLELLEQQDKIERAIDIKLQKNDVQGAIDTLDERLKEIHTNMSLCVTNFGKEQEPNEVERVVRALQERLAALQAAEPAEEIDARDSETAGSPEDTVLKKSGKIVGVIFFGGEEGGGSEKNPPKKFGVQNCAPGFSKTVSEKFGEKTRFMIKPIIYYSGFFRLSMMLSTLYQDAFDYVRCFRLYIGMLSTM